MTGQMPLFGVPQTQLTSDDYYTPKWVFDALGLTFDLDVCAPPGGVPWVPARRFLTAAEDGLSENWVGTVWMNPPYSASGPWAHRFIAHGHGVALTQMSKARWCAELVAACDGFVFLGAVEFVGGPIFMPVWLSAFGDECVDAIANLGTVRVRRAS